MNTRRGLLVLCLLAGAGCVVRAAPVMPVGEVVMTAPPGPQVEVIGVAPSPNHVWIGGHWAWHGRWVWEPGFWEIRRAGHLWVEGHWTPHRGGYAWVPGHWRRV